MKNSHLLAVVVALSTLCLETKASVTINFDVGEITSAGAVVSAGTFLFISHGANNIFDSSSWTSGTSFLLGDDTLMGAFNIVNGSATSAISGYTSPTGYGSTKFTGIFLAGMSSTQINFTTGALNSGLTFGTSGGTSYSYGSYRTDSIEGFGFGPDGNMAWIIPNDGAALSLFAASNTDLASSGLYTGADISASLATTTSVIIIPEPSTAGLLGTALVALSVLRKRKFLKGNSYVS